MKYFEIDHAVKEHDNIIQLSGGYKKVKSGGVAGNLNLGVLESVLFHIKNDQYYPEFIDKLSHLVFSINKNHPFVDGNKRTSIVLGAFFLEINEYDFCVERFIQEMETISIHVAMNRVSKILLRKILITILNNDERSESLKLEILKAVDQYN